MKRLRLRIDGDWSAEDFAQLFSAASYVYSLFALVDMEMVRDDRFGSYSELPYFLDYMGSFPSSARRRFARALVRAQGGAKSLADPEFLKAPALSLMPDEQLKVRRCFYASPGGIDLAGIGQAAGHLKDIVLKMIELKTTARDRELKTRILEQDLRAAVLKNIRDEIDILKQVGYSEAEVRRIVAATRPAVGSLASLAERGQVTYVEEVDGENDG